MLEAPTLKLHFQSNKPLLLILGKDHHEREKLLSHAATFARTDQMILRVKGRTNYTPSNLIDQFKKHWAVKIKGNIKPYNEQFSDILECLQKNKQSCILLIEQAHLLPISVLAALCHLSHQQEGAPIAIRIILAGHEELSSKINALYLKQYALPPVINLPNKDTTNMTQNLKKNNQGYAQYWLRHRVKTAATICLIACGIIWWKLQSTHFLHPHAPRIAHFHGVSDHA